MQQNLKKSLFYIKCRFRCGCCQGPRLLFYHEWQRDDEETRSGTRLEALPGWGGGGSHVAPPLNFKTFRVVGVYKCLSLIVGFAVTVAIWPRKVVSCRDFMLRPVVTF